MTTYTLTGGQSVNASGDPAGDSDEFDITGSGNVAIGHAGVDYVNIVGLDNSIDGGLGFDAGAIDLSTATVTFHGNFSAGATETGVTLADGTHIAGMDELGIGFGSGDDVVSVNADVFWDLYGGDGNDRLTAGHNGSEISGGAGDDTLTGGAQNDFLYGFASTFADFFKQGDDDGSGHDLLRAGAGDDSLVGSLGNDTLNGGAGSDTVGFEDVTGTLGVTVKLGAHGHDNGGAGHDLLLSIENANGSALADTIIGDNGANTIDGRDGADILIGGGGADVLDGGAGDGVMDIFRYKAAADSAVGASDQINDFEHGIDLIDLSAIDADGNRHNGDTAFTVVHAFDGHAGELVIHFRAGSFSADIDGDGHADMTVMVNADALTMADFVL